MPVAADNFDMTGDDNDDEVQPMNRKAGFIRRLNNDSGLGHNEDGSVNASDDWWERNTQGQGYSECKRFKWGLPCYSKHLEVIFKHNIVDGTTGYVPQDVPQDNDVSPKQKGVTPQQEDVSPRQNVVPPRQYHEVEEDDDDEDFDSFSPMSTTNSRKRGSSTTSTGTSPGGSEKKAKPQRAQKAPMVNVLTDFCSESSKNAAFRNELLEKAVNKKIEFLDKKQSKKTSNIETIMKAQNLALECGVSIDSPEFYCVAKIC